RPGTCGASSAGRGGASARPTAGESTVILTPRPAEGTASFPSAVFFWLTFVALHCLVALHFIALRGCLRPPPRNAMQRKRNPPATLPNPAAIRRPNRYNR